MDDWVSVEDHLPLPRMRVLTKTAQGHECRDYYTLGDEADLAPGWAYGGWRPKDDQVTHWRQKDEFPDG